MRTKILPLLVALILTACSSSQSLTPSSRPNSQPTPAPAAAPLTTNTPVPSPTATPVPIGGGQLLVAFYASGSCGACIIVGNFFTGEVFHTIPLSNPQMGKIFWSPDGNNFLYTEITSRMNVFMFNLSTGQAKKLGDFPPSGGTPEFTNALKYVSWSYDGEYVRFNVYHEDSKVRTSYYATKDGTLNSYSGGDHWFPDSRTLFSIYKGFDSYNVETKTSAPTFTAVLEKFKATYFLKNWIILERENTKVSAIPFPEGWSNDDAWLDNTLYSQMFTLAELTPEISNRKISLDIVQPIDENRIALIGSVYTSSQWGYFVKLVDLQNLPAIITLDDTLPATADTPLIVSPDGNFYVKAYCTFTEACPHFDANFEKMITRAWGFLVVSFNGEEQALPADLSQFKGVTKAYINVINTSVGLLDGIAFYWK
ncbi:MAG: hypothetical protein HY867_17650 [Chloroflexi bacterium]|nr:hypothetical protein [Chloroflexota bacterium]